MISDLPIEVRNSQNIRGPYRRRNAKHERQINRCQGLRPLTGLLKRVRCTTMGIRENKGWVRGGMSFLLRAEKKKNKGFKKLLSSTKNSPTNTQTTNYKLFTNFSSSNKFSHKYPDYLQTTHYKL